MKKNILRHLMAALVLALPVCAGAQEVLTVGDGSATNWRVPYYCYWGSMAQKVQVIYDETLLGEMTGNEITSLTFYVATGTSQIGDATVTLGTTETDNFASGQWVQPANTAEVYSGPVAIEGSQFTITFTAPYAYNAGNLVVEINYAYTIGNTASVSWLGEATDGLVSAHDHYLEGQPQDTYAFLPKTTFGYSPNSCLPPDNLTLVWVDTTSAGFAWTGSPTAIGYTLSAGGSSHNTTETFLDVDSLVPGELYTATLTANCEGGATSMARTLTFRTVAAVAEVPYSTSFEEADEGWQTLNDNSAWVVGNATSHSGSQSLYISADGGVTQGSDIEQASYSFAYRTFHLDSEGQYRLDYSWKSNNGVTYDYGRAYVVPAGAVFEAGVEPDGAIPATATPQGWINAGRMPMRLETEWQSDSCIFTIGSDDTMVSVVFLWFNTANGNGTSSIAIDDLSLVKLPCATITSLTLDSTTASSATFSWDNTHYTYQIEARLGDSVCASATVDGETTATLTGLTIDNDYEVYLRGVCDASEEEYTAWYGPVVTHIGYCQPTPMRVDGSGIVEVSYGTGLVATNTNHPQAAPYYASYHNVVGVASPGDVMPVDITYSTTFGTVYDYGTIIWIDWNRDLEFSGFEVVFVGESDTTDPSTVHADISIPTSAPAGDYRMRIAGASTAFDDYIGSISAAAAANPCFSFDWAVAHDYTLRVAPPTECPNVDSVNVDSVSDRTVSLSWPAADSGEASYTILLGTDTIATGIDGTDYTVDNLTPNTQYTFTVSTNCADGSSSYGTYAIARTDCGLIDELPFYEPFTSHDALNCWLTYDLDGVNTTDWYLHQFGEVRSNYSNAGDANDWLVTPPVAIGDYYDAVNLSFDAHGNNDANTLTGEVYPTHMTVLLSTSGDAPTAFTDTVASLALPNAWTHYAVSLDTYRGDTVRLAFVHDSYFEMGPVVDNVRIAEGSVCAAPTHIAVTDITTNSIGIDLRNATADEHVLIISVGDSIVDSLGTMQSNWTFMGLQPATLYTIKVAAVCGDDLLYASPLAVVTMMPYDELPYHTTFDSVDALPWVTSTSNHGWFVGGVDDIGGNALFVSADSGATRGYAAGAAPSNYAYKTFLVPAGQYIVSYDWIGEGEAVWAYMRAFLAPAGATLADGISNGISANRTPDGWIALDGGTALWGSDEWQTVHRTFNIAAEGVYSLVFYWNSGVVGQPTTAAAVDNINFSALSCQAPTGLAFDSVAADAVSFSWTADSLSTASQWLVSVDGGAWQITNQPSFTATALSSGTMHTFAVSTYCGSGDTSIAISGSIRTDCADITSLPWYETFDTMASTNNASPMTCWNILGEGYVNAVNGMSYHGNGLQITPNHSTTPLIVVVPPISEPLNTLELTYYHRPEQIFSGVFSVGYITNVGDSTTFVSLVTYDPSAFVFEDGWTDFAADTVHFDGAPADARIAFRYDYTGHPAVLDWFWFIDELSVHYPGQTAPTFYTVELSTDDPTMGSVSPDNEVDVPAGQSFTATAIPASGYRFIGWGGMPGYDYLVTTNPYTFIPTSDISLTAYFEVDNSGIDDVAGEMPGVHVYPNPTRDVATVEVDGSAWVEVYTVSGRCLTAFKCSGTATVDMSAYGAGTYFVRASVEAQTTVQRLVVR